MNYLKQNLLSILIIVFLVGYAAFGGTGQKLGALDQTTFGNPIRFTNTVKIGTSGTAQSNQVITTCNPKADVSVAATTTAYINCTGLTGITSSDDVFAQFSTSTLAVGTNWTIVGASASSTAGAVDIKIMNLTGTTAVPSASAGAQFASSTRIFVAH